MREEHDIWYSNRLGMRSADQYWHSGFPVWATLDLIVDLDNSKQADKQEAACRRGGAFKQYSIGQIDVECSFNLLHDHSDATWEVVQDAFWTRKVVHVRVLDGPYATSGTEGSS